MYQLRIYLTDRVNFRVLAEGTEDECNAVRDDRCADQPPNLHDRFKVEAV